MAGIVAIHHIAYVQFLVLPFRVQRVLVVIGIDAEARRVNEVLAGEQVRDHGAVDTLVVAQVNTCGQFQQTLKELVVITRHKAHPVMVVSVLGQHVFGARRRSGVDGLDGREVKRTVRAAEIHR